MLQAWSAFGFRPTAVVISDECLKPARRAFGWLRRHGVYAGAIRLGDVEADSYRLAPEPPSLSDPESDCRRRGIAVVHTGPLDDSAVETLEALRPDLLIHAGAGIVRRGVLAVPRIATLNAHMGLLPRYRGMNVAEWAYFHGDAIGCTVHLIDPGIDTGPIICVRQVATDGVTGLAGLRQRADTTQMLLL
jgi:hypothetical protein